MRTWKCKGCGREVPLEQEDIAANGVPICGNCDTPFCNEDMELVPAPAAKTGIAEIDELTHGECRDILAEIFRFMYRNDDGTWDRDKEVPGTEMVSLLCAEMPELRPRPEDPQQERKADHD